MAEFELKSRSEVRIEFILASLTKDNYKERIETLASSLKQYDPSQLPILNKYKWLVENRLGNNVPSIATLTNEFPELNFINVVPIQDEGALSDYIFMYIARKKRVFLSAKLRDLSDKAIGQGISDDDTMDLYNYLTEATTDEEYVPITETFSELYKKQQKLEGISFLCPELDDLTGGITPGQVCTILGAPGSMKTTYSSNIAYNALKQGKNVLYVSLEEPAMQLYSKWLSRCSLDAKCPIPQKDIVQQNLDDKQWDMLDKTVIPLFNSYPGKFFILEEQNLPDYNITTLEAKFKEVDKYAKEHTGHGIDLLVVDHIQLLKFAIDGSEPNTVINRYVSFFRQMSLSWLHEKRPISVILLSQANREGYAYAQKNNGEYLSQHVAEASEIERASAYIVSVYLDPMLQITNQLTLYAVKLRGSQRPSSVIPVFEDGAVYQVGTLNNTTGISLENNVDESHLKLSDIDSMLEV